MDVTERADKMPLMLNKVLTAAFLVAVVKAVVHAVATRPQRDAAVVCLAGELNVLVALVIWTPWTRRRVGRGRESSQGET